MNLLRNLSSRRALAPALMCLALLVFVPAALGALTYWTPVQMAKKITGPVPQIPNDNASAPSVITSTVCHGVGTAHAGKFNTFRCTAQWVHGPSTVFARALPGGKFCASTVLAACPATPAVAGDPRICTNTPAPSTADPNRCALGATEEAVIRSMRIRFNFPGWTIGQVSCKGSNLVWNCQYQQLNVFGTYYQAKIAFSQVKNVWTATVAQTGGQGPSNCTATAGSAIPANSITKWAAGPPPVCTFGSAPPPATTTTG
jgi:hypothetical protein